MSSRAAFDGPALLSYGFRPFFLAATLFALLVLPLWWSVWRGGVVLGGPFAPTDWHAHEMIFGYGAAVVAGFLFTAVPNWTGTVCPRKAGRWPSFWRSGWRADCRWPGEWASGQWRSCLWIRSFCWPWPR
ncbi:NnrS family protein [Ponticoccus litoralis]|uniref:NnrS family protein n=1 Tax=Ponticoccus litoralis TaxID=422297 RepID=A0AAW9SS87_9RHOB